MSCTPRRYPARAILAGAAAPAAEPAALGESH
jgi:hypothetical protein